MSKTVQQQIGNIALVVENYDDAIEFYTQKLQFTLVEDTSLGGGKRWVQVSPPNSNGTRKKGQTCYSALQHKGK